VLQKEADHFGGRIGAARIGVRTSAAAANPRVASPMYEPVFEQHSPAGVAVERPGEGMTVRRSTLLGQHLPTVATLPVCGP